MNEQTGIAVASGEVLSSRRIAAQVNYTETIATQMCQQSTMATVNMNIPLSLCDIHNGQVKIGRATGVASKTVDERSIWGAEKM